MKTTAVREAGTAFLSNSPFTLSGFFSTAIFGAFSRKNSTSASAIERLPNRNSTENPHFSINAKPIAGATAVASAVASPKMPMPSAKRERGTLSVAMVAVEVLENANAAPCTIRHTNASTSVCRNRYPSGIRSIPKSPTARIIFRFPLSSIHPINGRQTTETTQNSATAIPATASEPPSASM